jgi:hypothetical protein
MEKAKSGEPVSIIETGNKFRDGIERMLTEGEEKPLLNEIKRVIKNNDDYRKELLIAQLNVYCSKRSSKCKLLRHKLGEKYYKQLIDLGLYNYEGHSISTLLPDIYTMKELFSNSLDELYKKLNHLK